MGNMLLFRVYVLHDRIMCPAFDFVLFFVTPQAYATPCMVQSVIIGG